MLVPPAEAGPSVTGQGGSAGHQVPSSLAMAGGHCRRRSQVSRDGHRDGHVARASRLYTQSVPSDTRPPIDLTAFAPPHAHQYIIREYADFLHKLKRGRFVKPPTAPGRGGWTPHYQTTSPVTRCPHSNTPHRPRMPRVGSRSFDKSLMPLASRSLKAHVSWSSDQSAHRSSIMRGERDPVASTDLATLRGSSRRRP